MKDIVCEDYLGPRLSRETQLRRVRNVMEQELTDCQRRIAHAFFVEEKNVTQIAEELGVNKSTVSRTLQRARARMRRSLRY